MPPQPPVGTTTIEVPSLGTIKGLSFSNGTNQFCGIPYAELSKRWSRCSLKTSLQGGFHDGTQHGSICPQPPEYTVGEDYMVPVKPFPHFSKPAEEEFSSFNLNIVTPPKSDSGPCPVMVWIHGGSLIFGSSTHPVFDMVNLVSYANERGTPILGVSINYRVGLFGFLASTSIQEDLASDGFTGAGNFGFTDQQTALQWVQKYISSFGGDPKNVTIFGESAGGISVSHQIWASQPAVFHRGISMSGSLLTIPTWTLEQHNKRYQALLDHFGIKTTGADALEQLRALPQEAIAAATCPIEGTVDPTGNPCDDGLFRQTPASLRNPPSTPPWLRGFMIGDVRDEGMLFTNNLKHETQKSAREKMSKFLDRSGVDLVFDQYNILPHSSDAETRVGLEKMASDALFVYQDRLIAQASRAPTFAYHIDQQSTLENPYKGLAYHAIDLLYVFLNMFERMTESQQQLAYKVAGDFLDFSSGKEPWVPYASSQRWMIYGPNDGFSVATEEEDEKTRSYRRMDAIVAAGVFDGWWYAVDYIAGKRWALGNYRFEAGGRVGEQ